MKKFTAMLLALTMAASLLAGCGAKEVPATEAPTQAPTAASTEAPAAALEGTLEEIIEKIYAQHPVELALASMPVDLADTSEDGLWNLKRFTGLDSPEGITEAAVSEPMIGSQAYSLVLVRVAEPANARSVAEAMQAGIDPAKWVCVMADEMAVCGFGDVVMLAMLSTELGGELGTTAQDLVDAFAAVCGAEPDFVL